MKVKFKLLSGVTFELEVGNDELVSAVKARIEKEQGHQSSWQKFIFSGKVLEDNTKISEGGVKDGDFLVLMVRKPRETEVKKEEKPVETKPAEPTPEVKPPSQPARTQPPPAQPATQAPSQPTPSQPPAQPPSSSTGGIAVGSEFEGMVDNLVAMGFEKSQVIKAMRAAFNNPERAVEYLTTGIPEIADFAPPPQQSVPQLGNPPPQARQQPQAQPSGTSQGSTAFPNINLPQTSGQPSPFDFLRQHPQFNTLRSMIQANPQLLQPVLQQLGQQNPHLLQLINQHQNEFMQLLNEPVQGSQGTSQGSPSQPPQGGAQGGPGGPSYIRVTEDEKAAIERLEGLGFDRAAVLEAYFACDKNETLAANYLLENAGGADDFEDLDDQNPMS